MQRSQLEHIIRAAAAITGAREFVIIGSQAVLGQFPDARPSLLASMEVDVFTLRNPADADLIDGSIGEGSPFHQKDLEFVKELLRHHLAQPETVRERLTATALDDLRRELGLERLKRLADAGA